MDKSKSLTMKFTPRKLILTTSLMVLATSLMATDSIATTAPESQPQISACPGEFFAVKIHEDAKQCQPFDTELPASMVYFIGDTPDAIVAYYLALMPDLSLKGDHNGRVLLVNQAQNIRVVVSPDGEGAQVDVLVMASQAPESLAELNND